MKQIAIKALFSILTMSFFCCTSMAQSQQVSKDEPLLRGGVSYALIKKELVIGQSTQADVVKKFGSPNNMVFQGKSGELWIYDQIQTETSTQVDSNNSGFSVGVLGGTTSGVLGASGGNKSSQSTSKSTSSVRTLTVILDFNAKGILTDISARVGGY